MLSSVSKTFDPSTHLPDAPDKTRAGSAMALAALGIVYGDLDTSPLDTHQAMVTSVGEHSTVTDALGLLSLVPRSKALFSSSI